MPLIEINPKLWTVDEARPTPDSVLRHGETLEVSVEDWEEIRLRTTRQMGNRYKTYASVDEDASKPVERFWVRESNLLELSKTELQEAASDRGLSASGSKPEIAARIVAFEHETAEAEAESDGADV